MENFFTELFQYSNDTNQQLIDLIGSQGEKIPANVIRLFSHLLNAHHVWNARITKSEVHYGIWQLHTASDFGKINRENIDHSVRILNSRDLEEMIGYTTSKGAPFTNSIKTILFQVINHSTYHRGQIALELRQAGIDPPLTDYIFWKR
ncbi:DinB family protein [Ferruginibacter paludis]|uniref:DinB family protein n=1 Tax=Ferruginibacter paludis TaxID=1310417 RepID=UPI0025B28972|nr:DinB family protein [Ferruginibacter paludis]MDN3655540.1 DinB family protein [Ferruginibacter paludis]